MKISNFIYFNLYVNTKIKKKKSIRIEKIDLNKIFYFIERFKININNFFLFNF